MIVIEKRRANATDPLLPSDIHTHPQSHTGCTREGGEKHNPKTPLWVQFAVLMRTFMPPKLVYVGGIFDQWKKGTHRNGFSVA